MRYGRRRRSNFCLSHNSRSIFSSIVRSFSVKRPPAKKNLSLSNGDLTRPAATGHRPTRLTVGALRNDEACDYDKVSAECNFITIIAINYFSCFCLIRVVTKRRNLHSFANVFKAVSCIRLIVCAPKCHSHGIVCFFH